MMEKRALTLIEILVSVIILSLVFVGLAGVFVASKRYIQHSRSRMTAAELGKFFLDPFQNHVNQSTWGTSGNYLSNPPAGYTQRQNILGREYEAEYVITPGGLANLTRVKVTITLPSI